MTLKSKCQSEIIQMSLFLSYHDSCHAYMKHECLFHIKFNPNKNLLYDYHVPPSDGSKLTILWDKPNKLPSSILEITDFEQLKIISEQDSKVHIINYFDV